MTAAAVSKKMLKKAVISKKRLLMMDSALVSIKDAGAKNARFIGSRVVVPINVP